MVGLLEGVDIFKNSRNAKGIPDDMLRLLVNNSTVKKYKLDDVILNSGIKNRSIFILLNGFVSVYVDGDLILNLKRQGDVFGEISVLTNKLTIGKVVAQGTVDILIIHLPEDTKELQKNPSDLFKLFSHVLSDKLYLTTQTALSNNKNTVKFQQQLLDTNKIISSLQFTKDSFISIIAHDLRGPIINSRLLLSNINTDNPKYTTSEIKTFKHLIDISTEQLELVESLITSYKKPFFSLELSETNIYDIVERAKLISISTLESKGLEFKNNVPKDLVLKVDNLKIRQVFNNLVSNSSKFTTIGSIEVNAKRTSKNDYTFTVTDTGEGITKVMEKNTNKSGIGLQLVKDIISLHGGRFKVETPNKGTIVRFTLPIVN